ncbi:hypothetical protein GLP24_18110 [Photobacterium carnosum]|uniref:CapA family protein n=1 Tax=Photobacterium carnosum TaxID=2023717 RepID=UPI001E552645|nr:CapA family protein [Photobacterium carnosum]MCD9546752.1 hypothetical protein [Photobacterium carnosum]
MKIAFVGDIAFFGKFDRNKNKNLNEYFLDVKTILDTCDYCIGNLEAPFINKAKKKGSKSAYISSDASNVAILKYLNINAVCLANNHIYDFGLDGLNETINLLNSENIKWFGVNNKDLILDDYNLAFHGYCSYNTNPLGLKNKLKRYGVNALNYDDVKNKFKYYSDSGYLNILAIHSGIEHVNLCSSDDLMFARNLANIDNYIYYGHHPHVLQGVENYKGSILAYSLGNFCFDDVYDDRTSNLLVKQSENNKSSIILLLTIDDGKNIKMEYIPIYQGVDKLYVNNEIANDIYKESIRYLELPLSDYNKIRVDKIKSISSIRNSKRDISWFLKRISISTLIRVFERRLNDFKYKRYFSSKLKKTL